MKKLFVIFAFSVMAFAMVGCGKSNNVTFHYFKANTDNTKVAELETIDFAIDDDGHLTTDAYTEYKNWYSSAKSVTSESKIYTLYGAGTLLTDKTDEDYKLITDATTSNVNRTYDSTDLNNLSFEVNKDSFSFKDNKNVYVIYTTST